MWLLPHDYDMCVYVFQQEVHSILTTHQSNIFSARFLPWGDDIRVVSCAGVGSVELSEITPMGSYISHPFQCHRSITYQVSKEVILKIIKSLSKMHTCTRHDLGMAVILLDLSLTTFMITQTVQYVHTYPMSDQA